MRSLRQIGVVAEDESSFGNARGLGRSDHGRFQSCRVSFGAGDLGRQCREWRVVTIADNAVSVAERNGSVETKKHCPNAEVSLILPFAPASVGMKSDMHVTEIGDSP